LTLCDDSGENLPHNGPEHQVKTAEFFATHSVFSIDEATRALAPPGGRLGTVERLKYHLEAGRLKLVTRGVYTVVPPGVAGARFRPDPILVAAAVRPDGTFSHHSALELLGVAHSMWSQFTLYTGHRRKPLRLDGTTIRFLEHPVPMRTDTRMHLGTRRIERKGKVLEATGPERTLIEGFRRPDLAGGLEELVVSAMGFTTLDLDLLQEILDCYGIAYLWGAIGWFLERYQQSFHVPEKFLRQMAKLCPAAPQYLVRNQRGGVLASRWNLILPRALESLEEPDDP
jgi:predicted transcriptional regulator of viral defense system